MAQLAESRRAPLAFAEVRREGEPSLDNRLGHEEAHGLGGGEAKGLEEAVGLFFEILIDANLHGCVLGHGSLLGSAVAASSVARRGLFRGFCTNFIKKPLGNGI